jgi:hypothetical protein
MEKTKKKLFSLIKNQNNNEYLQILQKIIDNNIYVSSNFKSKRYGMDIDINNEFLPKYIEEKRNCKDINSDNNKNIFLYKNKMRNPLLLSNNLYPNINPNYMKEKFFNINRNQYRNDDNKQYLFHNKNLNVLKTDNYSINDDINNINHNDKIIYKTPKKIIRNSLDVKDINNYKGYRLSNRETNPIDPRYNYDWQMTEINENRKLKNIDFGEIGNHPKPLYLYNNKNGKGLNTYDIVGAQPGTKSHLSKLEIKYGRPMNHRAAEDIIGSHPGSLIKGIKTNRNTNPLNPDYPVISGQSLEYGNEKDNKHEYDYKSLLDYYNKHSKITKPYKDDDDSNTNDYNNNNNIKINNSMKQEYKKIERIKNNNLKNIFYNFGSDKKIYPREQYVNIDDDDEEKNIYNNINMRTNSYSKY